jgi:L-2-hydroxyglutarate oxidase LhgO
LPANWLWLKREVLISGRKTDLATGKGCNSEVIHAGLYYPNAA